MTAREIDGARFRADVVEETLRRTTLGELVGGARVNLELALRASDRLGGHVVLGHVDGVGEVTAQHASGEIEVAIDPSSSRATSSRRARSPWTGSASTVAAIDGATLTIALIPQTKASTTLGEVRVGQQVNVEVDILAKHLERLVTR